MSSPITHPLDFVIVFDVTDGNPNGDPDRAGAPRQDTETDQGLVSGGSCARKIRDFVLEQYLAGDIKDTENHKFGIQVVNDTALDQCQLDALSHFGATSQDKLAKLKKADPNLIDKLHAYLCDNYFDIRTFGAVCTQFAQKKLNSQIKGPVHIETGRSVDPVYPMTMTITRAAASNQNLMDELGDEMIGRRTYIPYGLYVQRGHIDVPNAQKTGFDTTDLGILWDTIKIMYQNDHAVMRGEQSLRALIVFEHASKYRNANPLDLCKLIHIKKREGVEEPRSIDDYELITIDEENLPQGVSVSRLV